MCDRNRRGFSLAELLIVMSMITALTAVSAPTFTGLLEKSRETVDLVNLRLAYDLALRDAVMGTYKRAFADKGSPYGVTYEAVRPYVPVLAEGDYGSGNDSYYAILDPRIGKLVTWDGLSSPQSGWNGKGTSLDGGTETQAGPIYYRADLNAKEKMIVVTITDADGCFSEADVGFASRIPEPEDVLRGDSFRAYFSD